MYTTDCEDIDKLLHHSNIHNYTADLLNFMTAMFDYTGLPSTLDKRFLERYLNCYGSAVIGEIGGNLYCTPPNLEGEIDAYNLGTIAFGVTPIGEIRGVRGENVVWGLNNELAYPSVSIGRTADTLAQIDLSIKALIKNARIHPIPVAKDAKDKAMLDKIYEDIDNGKIKTIVSSNLLNNMKELETSDPFTLLNLTDPTLSDKIQYLYHAKDDELRQFYTKYGQAVQGTGKMAQQTEREIDGSTSVSFILPYQMLQQRKIMCDELNRIFGTSISVDFSIPWKVEYEHFQAQNESAEESTDDSTNSSAESEELND